MYSNDFGSLNKFYIIKDHKITIKNSLKVNKIALIINIKEANSLRAIKEIVKKNIHNQIFIANNSRLIVSKKIMGVYLSSYNNKINNFNKNHTFNYNVIGGAHNISEIRKKFQLGCDAVFLSPVFKTTSHLESKPIGLVRFLLISKLFKNKVYPLGGVNPKNLGLFNTLKKFAGISFFK
jgi:thiamine-phosphate pyrophosphorylase